MTAALKNQQLLERAYTQLYTVSRDYNNVRRSRPSLLETLFHRCPPGRRRRVRSQRAQTLVSPSPPSTPLHLPSLLLTQASDSWLARQNRKKSRRKFLCPIFWLCFFLFVTAMVGVIIWLLKSGILANVKIGNGHGTPNQPANPNGGIMGGNKRRGLEGLVRMMLVEGVR